LPDIDFLKSDIVDSSVAVAGGIVTARDSDATGWADRAMNRVVIATLRS